MTRCASLATLTLIVLAGCRPAQPPGDEEPEQPPRPVPVQVARAVRTTIRPRLEMVGTLVAYPERTVTITAQTAGRIAELAVVEGQAVAAGDVLARLDPQPAQLALAASRADRKATQARLERLLNGPRPQEIEAARQRLKRAAARLSALKVRLDALKQLHERGELPDVEFAAAQADCAAAEAEQSAAQAELDLLLAGTREEEIAAARSALEAAQAAEQQAQLRLDYCTIASPTAGVVVELPVRSGAWVDVGDRLAVVVDVSTLLARVRIPSVCYESASRASNADVAIGPDGDRKLSGRLVRLSPVADEQTGDVWGFVELDNADGHLRPGLVCRVSLWLPPVENVIAIPLEAVADRDGQPVATVVRDNRAYEIPIGVGTDDGRLVEVTSGISESELVATRGGYGLPDGCPVAPQPEQP